MGVTISKVKASLLCTTKDYSYLLIEITRPFLNLLLLLESFL